SEVSDRCRRSRGDTSASRRRPRRRLDVARVRCLPARPQATRSCTRSRFVVAWRSFLLKPGGVILYASPIRSMSNRTRRAFISTAAAGVTGSWLAHRVPALRAQAPDSRIEVLVGEAIGTVAPDIYGHFVEHLGGVVYDGIWVGEGSKVPHVGGIR